MKNNINDQLTELYIRHWEKLSNELNRIKEDDSKPIKPTNPLLLSLSNIEQYENADIKVMIFGQETNNWEGVFRKEDSKYLMKCYLNFIKGNRFSQHKGQFKNHFNKFVTLIEKKYPKKSIGVLWNNVIKIGKADEKGLPPNNILEIIKNNFSILKDEIRIVKPNIILFYSGPYYDKFIFEQIPQIKRNSIDDFKLNQLASFDVKDVDFCFRTYHPNYLNRLGKNEYDRIYNTILSKLSF